jgi:hypothetical protein
VSLSWAERLTVFEPDGSLTALRDALAPLARKRARVTVVLSNRLVRYAIVPFDPAIRGAQEGERRAGQCVSAPAGAASRASPVPSTPS